MLLGMKLDEAVSQLRADGTPYRTQEYVDRKSDLDGVARVIRVTVNDDGNVLLVYTYMKKDVSDIGTL